MQNKILKDSESTQQLVKLKEANNKKSNLNPIETKKDYQEKTPLIDLATDFYEGADVVEIDIGISYNSSINNNSLLNSKNYNEEIFKKSKLDNMAKINNMNNDLDNFEGSLENINYELNNDAENEPSIQEFKLNVNTVDEMKNKKILIENLEVNVEGVDLDETSPIKKPNYYKTSKANGIQSSPSTKNFIQNNLNSANNTVKCIKTNFESTRNMNSNFNLNSNKNLIQKKSTTKNSYINTTNNTNTLKSEDAPNNNANNSNKEKTKEKFPHSKTLKILKNNHLNFMNNAFKVLAETQGNLNYNKIEKAKTLLTFSKEKDNQALSFRVSKKSNNTQLKNLTSLKKEPLKNSNSVKPFQEALSKKKINGTDNFNNLETKRTISNNKNLLSNKLIFNTTSDLKEEIKKPYSQDKDISKRKFITDKSLNKKDLKNSLNKNNLIFNEQNNKNKKIYELNLNKNQVPSKKKFEKGKNDNLISHQNKKAKDNKLSEVTFISNKNVKDSNARDHEKKIATRKSVSNNPLSYKNDVNSNTTNLNINCTINNTNPNNNNYVFTVNQTIGNTNSEKNLNSVKNNAILSTKQSLNKSNNNINNDKKSKVNNHISNGNNNQKESLKNQKLSHNISQKYLKQFFSSLTNNTIIGNVNVNISNSNLKITQNIPPQENSNFNASFKSNYRNSEIPIKNNIEISFESTDEANLNENVFIEEPRLAKSIKTDKDSKQKSVNSPSLIAANRAINKMLNKPVSEYKLINLRDYNITDQNQILLNSSENLDINVPSNNQILTENTEGSKSNLNSLKNNLSDKHFDRINVNLIDKNALNANKCRANNTYRNTLNINLNSKKNFSSNNNNNTNNFERANTFSNQKKTSSSSKQANSTFKKLDSEIKLNEANLSTSEISIFKGKIDDYSIGKEIGKGAYAIVKQAIHKPTNRKFAIKIYEKVKLLDAERKGSVKREIQILKKMDHHDNIVKLIEVIETTRQLVEGISLLDLLKSRENRRIDENECRKVFSQLVNAIAFCHSKNIIHRDIKLENIIVDSNFNLKLIDFGFGAVSPNNKLQSFFCGTPSYMPPEIVQKKDYIGYLADIWSLGILLFTLLCGAFPFRANSEKELYGKITKGIFTFPEHLSQNVCELIKKILVIKPTDRPTAQDILSDKWFNTFYSHHKNVKDCIILEENELNFNSKNN